MKVLAHSLRTLLVLLIAGFVSVAFSAPPSGDFNSPVGYWKTYSKKKETFTSIVQIQKERNGTLTGTVYEIFEMEDQHPDDVCEECKGALHNKPIQGMQIISGMKQKSDTVWGGGKILDPDNGKYYSSKMTLVKDGKVLKLRGYIGISLIGRTEAWHRTPKPRR